MICPKCQSTIPNDADFCQVCGTRIQRQATPVQQTPTSASKPVYVQQIPVQPDAKSTRSSNVEELLYKQKRILKGIQAIEILMVLTVACLGYMVFVQYRQTHSSDDIDSSNRVLVVEINEDLSKSELSDSKQINEALKNGGMIRLKASDLESGLKDKMNRYAAPNSSSQYWVLGALLNYLASEGWELTQAPTTGLSQMYYFKR